MTRLSFPAPHRILTLGVMGLALAAFISGPGQAASIHAQNGSTAEIRQFAFSPNPLQVSAGSMATWTNTDAIEHSITSGSPDSASGVFDSGFINQGQTFSFQFDQPGDYTYFCRRHTFMQATVSVS